MVERLFEYLFVAALFAPPIAVVAGIGLQLIPRRRHHVQHAPHAVGA